MTLLELDNISLLTNQLFQCSCDLEIRSVTKMVSKQKALWGKEARSVKDLTQCIDSKEKTCVCHNLLPHIQTLVVM